MERTKTEKAMEQDDIADIMNRINDVLENTEYEAVGYNNTQIFFHVLIEKRLENDK